MPSIQAQDTARSWSSPLFHVDPNPNRAYAVEVAAEALLLDSAERNRRTPENFFASWEQGGLVSEPVYRLPEAVWQRLNRHPRLFYRLHTSASLDVWVDHLTTLSDDQATNAPWLAVFQLDLLPEDSGDVEAQHRLWQAASVAPAVQQVRAQGPSASCCIDTLSALVVR